MDRRRPVGHSSSRRLSRSRSRSVSPSKRKEKSESRRSRDSPRISTPARSNFVCIRNLPSDTGLSTLQAAILEFVGSYLFVQILHQPGSASKKALIEFENDDLVRKCFRKMDQLRFGDRKVEVREVEDVAAFLRKHGAGGLDTGGIQSQTVDPRTHGKRDFETADAAVGGRDASFTTRYLYDQLLTASGTNSSTRELRTYNAAASSHPTEVEGERSSQPEWLFSGDVDDSNSARRGSKSPDEAARLETLQKKLWSSVWKSRLGKKVISQNTSAAVPTISSAGVAKVEKKESVKAMSDVGLVPGPSSSSANDPVANVALEIMTGAFHIRRALEIMRKSDAARDAFHASALFLRQFNDELSDWTDMYFSRDPEASRGGLQLSTTPGLASSGEEKEKSKNSVEVKGTWSLDEAPTLITAIPSLYQNSAVKLSSFANIATIQTPLSSSWFMIGPAQPRFSATAAIRRGALEPLVEVPRDKAKIVLTQFAHVASTAVLSRVIRAISMGAYVDLDWFSRPDLAFEQPALVGVHTALGDCGIAFSNWYRCIEFVIRVAETIGAPGDYLASLTAYRRVVEMWWRLVASADKQAAGLLWLPFYELFDKSWRLYAARSPEYRDKLHLFDAWWVFHQLDPTALKLRVPLPPYDAQTCGIYVRQVAAHYEEMTNKAAAAEHISAYNHQKFDTSLDACSICSDHDHKLVENGRAVQLYCPFASRRISWCVDMYEGVCESEACLRGGKHVCAHCGNPGQVVKTCPNCKCLVV